MGARVEESSLAGCESSSLGRRPRRIKSLDAWAPSRLGEGVDLREEATMRQGRFSIAGLSVLFALGLALWEVYFFWFAGSFPWLEAGLTPERLGFQMAWPPP